MKDTKKHAALALVLNEEGKVLLLRRSPTAPIQAGVWAIPGGMVDEDEAPEDAAWRELKEESGLEAYTYEHILQQESETLPGTLVDVFKLRVVATIPVVLSYEHDDYGWFNTQDIPENTGPISKRLIGEYTEG